MRIIIIDLFKVTDYFLVNIHEDCNQTCSACYFISLLKRIIMLLRIVSIIVIILVFMSCQNMEDRKIGTEKERIVAVFAHPDDETTVGPVLAKYANDHDVYLIIATDGSYGVTDHAGIPEGDSLISIRNKEAACSCKELGINPPIQLGLIDGMGFYNRGDFYESMSTLKVKLNEEFLRLRPSKVITFGPDGDTGHHDHRLVGNIVTQVLMSHADYRDIDLYYFGWTKEQAGRFPQWNLGYVAEEYLDTAIPFSEADEAKAIKSIRCHESQFTQKEFDDWEEIERNDPENTIYFRKATRSSQKSSKL